MSHKAGVSLGLGCDVRYDDSAAAAADICVVAAMVTVKVTHGCVSLCGTQVDGFITPSLPHCNSVSLKMDVASAECACPNGGLLCWSPSNHREYWL